MKYLSTPLIMFISLLFIANSMKAQLNETHYRIYSTKLSKEVSLADIVKEMQQYDVLFYGEEHNDSVTHFIEQQLLQMLNTSYPSKITLSMEMFDCDVQTVMNEYLAGVIKEKNLKKDARVWTNYNDYKPMVEYAKASKLDVVCANAAGRYSNLVGRSGMKALNELPLASKINFAPLPFDTAKGKYHDKVVALTTHTPAPVPVAKPGDTAAIAPAMSMPPMGNFNFVLGQSLWDATMAYSIASYMKSHVGKKVMQVNGKVHSEEGYGAVTQLKKYKPGVRTLIVTSFPDEQFKEIKWEELKHLGDYVIVTDPEVPRTYE